MRRVLVALCLLAAGAHAVPFANIEAPSPRRPKVTAVVLNWQRLRNVVHIVETSLCSPELSDVLDAIVVWNNNPRYHLTRHHFALAPCFASPRLKIVNSPSNDHFLPRFLACAAATTDFCFVQDDDYLVQPRAIRTLHNLIQIMSNTSSIHLLPPHEYLTTALRTTVSQDEAVHTGFAWLGHGTILHRASAVHFLTLLRQLQLTSSELKMADNYFTVLANEYPVVLQDIGIPLDGQHAFTVGTAGDERNWLHINKALSYLKQYLSKPPARPNSYPRLVHRPVDVHPFRETSAVCLRAQCILRSNIGRITQFPIPQNAFNLREHETFRRSLLGEEHARNFIENSLAAAVDQSNFDTAFRSFSSAKQGDYFILDLISPVRESSELHVVIDEPTRGILEHVMVEVSPDEKQWVRLPFGFSCDTYVCATGPIGCFIPMSPMWWRYIRLSAQVDYPKRWTVFNIVVRPQMSVNS